MSQSDRIQFKFEMIHENNMWKAIKEKQIWKEVFRHIHTLWVTAKRFLNLNLII